ncbi:Mevalonate galactokinase [Echinococcus multilocularis]|uniref:Mevalonate kinase n=1 Tax=Echinococcus multilocularis TaxID=6211 RepID=A0A068Y6D1_ECHMU|nr:Mevalonate galactokinase [Echinococcus multilocularis]
MVSISAPGKVILFGEHAVVYGCPALVASIDASTTLKFHRIIPCDDTDIAFRLNFINFIDRSIFLKAGDLAVDFSPNGVSSDMHNFFLIKSQTLLSKLNVPNQIIQSVAVILLSYHILKSKYHVRRIANLPWDITLTSTLPINAGLGSSAAYCSVVATFFLYLYGRIAGPDLTEAELLLIQSFANDLEKIMHASPSGVDTAISTSGGMILFKKDATDGSTLIQPLSLPMLRDNLPKLLIINTNTPRSTADVVDSVRKFRECEPELCNQIFKDISAICEKAEGMFSSPLEGDSLDVLCKLFLQNHNALCKLGVSNEVLDEIVRRLRTIGFGAKLTGAGRGGCAIALPFGTMDSRDAVDRVRNLLQDLNVTVFEATFCAPGIRMEIA